MAFFIFLGTLTRYEVWSLVPSSALAIILTIVGFSKNDNYKLKKIESRLILFLTLALLGILIWLTWNLLIFNDPLYFFKRSLFC